jgi:hypothetical protein
VNSTKESGGIRVGIGRILHLECKGVRAGIKGNSVLPIDEIEWGLSEMRAGPGSAGNQSAMNKYAEDGVIAAKFPVSSAVEAMKPFRLNVSVKSYSKPPVIAVTSD